MPEMDFRAGQPVMYRDPEHPVSRDPLGVVRGRSHGMYAVDMSDGRQLMVDGSVLAPVSHAQAEQHREEAALRREAVETARAKDREERGEAGPGGACGSARPGAAGVGVHAPGPRRGVPCRVRATVERGGEVEAVTGLVEFLRARLDEDEAAAQAATGEHWIFNRGSFAEAILDEEGTAVVAGGRWGDEAPVFETDQDALHIARHDPARVLAEVEAKRGLLRAHEKWCGGRCEQKADPLAGGGETFDAAHFWALKVMATVYADHPDYDPAWRPT